MNFSKDGPVKPWFTAIIFCKFVKSLGMIGKRSIISGMRHVVKGRTFLGLMGRLDKVICCWIRSQSPGKGRIYAKSGI